MFAGKVIGFIGAGNMAEAMIKGILARHTCEAAQICASHPNSQRISMLQDRYKIRACADNVEVAAMTDVLILAVKPQVLPKVLAEITGKLKKDALLISIVAGARIEAIAKALKHKSVVRSMPNTPGQIGHGMTVWTSSKSVGEIQKQQTQQILQALGQEIWVEGENYIDMATALSGTGPAYVFLFIEAMIDAGVHMGFSRHMAEKIVLQTLQGSVAVASQMNHHPAHLRNMVTSPGGTSAAALYELEKGGFRTILSKAIFAAFKKSTELGDISEAKLSEIKDE